MKKLLIAMAMMSAMAMAQTSSSTDQNTSNSSSTPQASSTQSSTSTDTSAQTSDTSKHKDHKATSDQNAAMPQSDKAAGKEKSVTGCLHKDGDNFWLATRTGKYHLMSSQDLSAHDGHEVKVTGTASKAPMPGSTDTKKINHLEASNVEMVADQCKMGTKTMKMKGDQLEKEQPKK